MDAIVLNSFSELLLHLLKLSPYDRSLFCKQRVLQLTPANGSVQYNGVLRMLW